MIVVYLIPLVITIIAILILLNTIGARASRPPLNSLDAFLSKGRDPSTRLLVVCAGDSLTHASISGDYVAVLRARFLGQGIEVVNAGRNNDTVFDLANRLDAIIACRPDVVTILIGTNDAHPTLDAMRRDRYLRRNGLASTADPVAAYRRQLDALVARLQSETRARIYLLSIPPLGEDLLTPANDRVRQYVDAIKAVAAAREVDYLPLYERLAAVLERPGYRARWSFPAKNRLIAVALFRHLLRGHSLNAISDSHSLILLADLMHLNERGAALVAALIGDALQDALQSASG